MEAEIMDRADQVEDTASGEEDTPIGNRSISGKIKK